jgi:hypothetical protein
MNDGGRASMAGAVQSAGAVLLPAGGAVGRGGGVGRWRRWRMAYDTGGCNSWELLM